MIFLKDDKRGTAFVGSFEMSLRRSSLISRSTVLSPAWVAARHLWYYFKSALSSTHHISYLKNHDPITIKKQPLISAEELTLPN
jgi:hypothetical protein